MQELQLYRPAEVERIEVVDGELVELRYEAEEAAYCESLEGGCGHYHRSWESCRAEGPCGDFRCCH